jgi:hypothetical protein
VWNFGDLSPVAQTSVRTAFLLWGDTPQQNAVNTNAGWAARSEPGWEANANAFPANDFHGVGPGEEINAKLLDASWNILPTSGNWPPAEPLLSPHLAGDPAVTAYDYSWHLMQDPLPPMEYDTVPAGHVVRNSGIDATGFPDRPLEVSAHSHSTILLDRDTLTTAYPELLISAGEGAKIRLTYAEALLDAKGSKGNRGDISGKQMNMGLLHDEFFPDGGSNRSFSPLWWRTWPFLQVEIETGDQPLSLLGLQAHFTAYPFRENATFHTANPELSRIWDVGWRTLCLNAHETHMDCPCWEQLQYVGDTRIEVLIDYVVSGDDRLAQQAIRAIASSVRPDGLTQSRYPNRDNQVLPPFSLLWIGMLHEYWMYRPDTTLPTEMLTITRSVLKWFIAHQRADGMLGKLPEDGYVFWHFVDWSFSFHGAPPEDKDGGSVSETLQFLAALREAADLEDAVGDQAQATAYRQNAARIASAIYQTSWDEKRQLLADTPARQVFSQHANILGVILDVIPPEKQKQVLNTILADELAGKPAYPASQNLAAASYYFRFYLARAIDHAGMGYLYLKLLGPWKDMLALGLTTWAETPDPTRSEAHAWSAHPSYDLLTVVAGIRPDSPGFRSVRIAPHLGTLDELDASMPYCSEKISVSYRRKGSNVDARVVLPRSLSGVLVWEGKEFLLHPGQQQIRIH